ncbi:MAG: isoprenyl transferase [Bacteroidota bacterium]
MKELREQIDLSRLPRHVAIIMDGNGRWAKQKGRPRVFGHRSAVQAVRDTTEAAAELGIEYLTLYAFSTENWNRPALEVNALMALLVETIRGEISTLNKNNIRLQAIGNVKKLPSASYRALQEGIESTKNNSRMTLNLALNYSAKWEIMNAVKSISEQVQKGEISTKDIDESLFSNFLATKGMPDPELLIRTSGEARISNFLLWQIAYSELYFTKIFWPDFRKDNLYEAILEFQGRERRFGKISEQLEGNKKAVSH